MGEAVLVRVAARGDMAALDALYARSYPKLLKADYPPSVLVTVLPLISKVQPGLVASGTYFVAELAGAIVGAGGWTPHRRGDVGEVRHVVTDDRHVRRGVGRALMAHVFDTASAAGLRRLSCRATRTAVPFYQAMGFVTLGPIEVPMGPGISFPAIQMQRML